MTPRVTDPSSCVIGIDVGGTKIAAGLVVFPRAEVLVRRLIPTCADRTGEEVLGSTLELAAGLVQEAQRDGRKVAGIGLGVAELVNGRGEITSGHTIHWQGLAVQDRLSALAPAAVEADVRAAALGEALYGAARGCRDVVYVSVGTGISYSLVQDGRPYAGARGNALILASSPMTHSCSNCGRRSTQVLEDFASGRAIGLRYSTRAGGGSYRGEDVMRLADQEDGIAIEIVETAGEALGVAVGFLVNILDPEVVVIGGGLGLCGGRYWECFVESARQHIWAEDSRQVPIVTAALGRDAGVVGAAAAFLEPGKMRRAPNGPNAER